MYNTEAVQLKARKDHICTSCAETIEKGQPYFRWVTFDDSAYTSKMHPECSQAHSKDASKYGSGGEWEYTPYSYVRGLSEEKTGIFINST